MLLKMQKGIIYGPVNSRRYGKSLGINLMPTEKKLCSFNCVYCHYGTTKRCTMNIEQYKDELPELDKVVNTLERKLKTDLELDLITFSGNGEPTLYPQFGELVKAVVELRGKYRPNAKVALLSNSTGLIYDDVVESLDMIDLPILKLDAGNEDTFRVPPAVSNTRRYSKGCFRWTIFISRPSSSMENHPISVKTISMTTLTESRGSGPARCIYIPSTGLCPIQKSHWCRRKNWRRSPPG